MEAFIGDRNPADAKITDEKREIALEEEKQRREKVEIETRRLEA